MLKLPEKRSVGYSYESNKYDEYAMYWNRVIDYSKYLCKRFGDERTKEGLLHLKDYIYKNATRAAHKGGYDCILEIERLNKESKEEGKNESNISS